MARAARRLFRHDFRLVVGKFRDRRRVDDEMLRDQCRGVWVIQSDRETSAK
jgi:hypothetical protein